MLKLVSAGLLLALVLARVARAEEPLRLSVADCVTLALRGNRTVQKAYLQRMAQRMDLRVAEHQFVPQGSLSALASTGRSQEGEPQGRSSSKEGTLSITQQIPTGGSFTFTWSTNADEPAGPQPASASSSWRLSAVQPLLRGGGTTAGRAALDLARIAEQGNVLDLKSTLISVVTSVILAFRELVLAGKAVEIREAALTRGHQLLEINRALIDAGRMASVELVQAEADIASQELGVITARNALDSARLSLLQLLTLNAASKVELVEETGEGEQLPGIDEALGMALRQRPDYQQALLSVKAAERDFAVARNGLMPDLGLEAGARRDVSGSGFWDTALGSEPFNLARASLYGGLTLGIPLNDLSRRQAWVRAKVALESARLDLFDRRDAVETEVRNAVRTAEVAMRQLKIARLGRTLSEKKLEVEKEKLRTGRSTNFQMVNFQNDLVSAQTTELSAVIDFRNALTNLDQALGTTLATWRIEVNALDEKPPSPPRSVETQ